MLVYYAMQFRISNFVPFVLAQNLFRLYPLKTQGHYVINRDDIGKYIKVWEKQIGVSEGWCGHLAN